MPTTRNHLKMFFSFLPTGELMDITKRNIKEWIFHGREQRNWAPKTIRNHLQIISSFCDWLVQEEYLPENPTKGIQRPRLSRKLAKMLRKDDAMRLLEWAQHYPARHPFERARAYAVIATFIFAGIRKSELLNLTREDVRLKEGELFIRDGKGRKDRMVPISPRLGAILRAYNQERERRVRTSPYFFVSHYQDTQLSETTLKRMVDKLREKSGIYFYPHLLRHTFATLMAQSGCPIYDLKEMLGHACISTTSIYLHTFTAHLREQIKRHPLG